MTASRHSAADRFLQQTDWRGGARVRLAGDASNRKYDRVFHPDTNAPAVLMDADPTLGEDVRPFVRIAQVLQAAGLSAPRILAEDSQTGFLLLEDLGDDLFKRVIAAQPALEPELYAAAIDVLDTLHRAPLPALDAYDAPLMTRMAALAWDWYRRGTIGPDPAAAARFSARLEPLLNRLTGKPEVLIQRDYHAENLLWLPGRQGVARVGLLDFQDAMAGHRAYDLVSLLQDARRDVPPGIEAAMIARYTEANALDPAPFAAAYAALGVQRNLRILGVFARLSLHNGKPHYIDLIPRVWGYLLRDLDHPALASIRDMVLADLPAPSRDILQGLKDQCASIPTL